MVNLYQDLFPLQEIGDALTGWSKALTWQDDGFSWQTPLGQSELNFQPASVGTLDKLKIVGFVTTKHQLPVEYNDVFTIRSTAIFNRSSSLSSIFPGNDKTGPFVMNRIAIFQGNEDAGNRLYAPLIATEAYMQPTLAFAIATNSSDHGPAFFGLGDANASPPYTKEEFDALSQSFKAQGFYANFDSVGVVVEFPWDDGAISSMAHHFGLTDGEGRTVLCSLTVDARHPNLGSGLLCTLKLPINFASEDQLVKVVNRLNYFEKQAADMPPFLGSWCADFQLNCPAFVAFFPKELCLPGLPMTVATWMGHRGFRIKMALLHEIAD